MSILAIDTASGQCAASILRPDGTCVESILIQDHGHAESLMPLIAGLLDGACLGFPEITAIAVSTGPGSFTGLRVGIAAARGLALTLNIPAIGIDSFTGFRASLFIGADKPEADCLIVLESRRKELYWAWFDHDSETARATGIDTAQAIAVMITDHNLMVGGDGARHLGGFMAAPVFLPWIAGPSPCTLARLAQRHRLAGNLPAPIPVYLRAADATPAAGR